MTTLKISRIIGSIFTIYGLIEFFKGNTQNGLLALCLGELIDIPKYPFEYDIIIQKNKK